MLAGFLLIDEACVKQIILRVDCSRDVNVWFQKVLTWGLTASQSFEMVVAELPGS